MLPFSWPFLAAFPIMLGIVAALSHGGVMSSWWRRLPAASAVGWLMCSFAAATAAAAVIAYLPAGGALVIVGLAGLVNARAWYGLAGLAARVQPRAHESVPARLLFSLPFAPIAAVDRGRPRGRRRPPHVHGHDPASDQPRAGRRGRRGTVRAGNGTAGLVVLARHGGRGGAATRSSWSAAGDRGAVTPPTACTPRCRGCPCASSPTWASARTASRAPAAGPPTTCRSRLSVTGSPRRSARCTR